MRTPLLLCCSFAVLATGTAAACGGLVGADFSGLIAVDGRAGEDGGSSVAAPPRGARDVVYVDVVPDVDEPDVIAQDAPGDGWVFPDGGDAARPAPGYVLVKKRSLASPLPGTTGITAEGTKLWILGDIGGSPT